MEVVEGEVVRGVDDKGKVKGYGLLLIYVLILLLISR